MKPKKPLPKVEVYPPPDRFQVQFVELDRLLEPFQTAPVTDDTLATVVQVCNINGFAVKSSSIIGGQMVVVLLDRTIYLGGS